MSEDKPTVVVPGVGSVRIGVAAARYNGKHMEALLARFQETLKECGLSEEMVDIYRVPGSHETIYVLNMLASTGEYDALVALGVVLAGETSHHEVLAQTTAVALHSISLRQTIPVINGIITVEDEKQARERCSGRLNRGREFALAALEMAHLDQALADRIQRLNEIEGEDDPQAKYWDAFFEEDEGWEEEDSSETWKS